MRGVPECADCGTQMQTIGGRYRCPFATSSRSRGIGGGPPDPDGAMIFCDQPMRRDVGGMSGHFAGSSDMRQARR